MSIATDCMVISVRIGLWMGYRLDRDATRKVTSEAGAVDDAARVNKHIIPKEALKPLVATSGAVRAHFYDRTLPWKDNGDRILPRAMYARFIPEHGELKQKFHDEVDRFLTQTYISAIDQAEFRMGELFKAEDYPTPRELRSKFYIGLDIDAVTEAGDFRVKGMNAGDVDRIKEEMNAAHDERIIRAMGDVWSRLNETLAHYADKMASDAIFRDSTVRNLENLIAIIPALNVTGNPKLTAITDEITEKLIGYEPNDLRKDKAVRNEAASEAQRILDDMAGFMAAMSGAAE